MKKILISLVLVGATLTVSAQQFKTMDFLAVNSLQVSNLFGFTNIISGGGAGSNHVGVIWTNLFGTKVVSSASTAYEPLVRDVTFPTDFAAVYGQASIAGTNTFQSPYCATINVRCSGGSGANTATSYVFQLLDGEGNVFTDRSFTFAVTPNTTTAVNMATNLTTDFLFGAKGMRVKTITAGDTDASSQVSIMQLNLNCWSP